MKLGRIIILGVAAWAGYLFYNHFRAFENLTTSTPPAEDTASFGEENIGGIGRIGGSYRDSQPTVPKNDRHKIKRLMQASIDNDSKAVRQHLNEGAPVDGRDDARRTALMYAAMQGHHEVATQLLAAGAHLRFKDRDGFSALDFAAGRGLVQTVQRLLDYSQTTDDNHYIEYATLMYAARMRDVKKLPAGTQKLASINRVSPDGQTPLHLATSTGSKTLMEALFARGATANVENADRQTPLHWAAWNNQTAAMELLLARGANIAQRDSGGNTALMLAAENNARQAVQLLLARGAAKNLANKHGKTARMIADEKGHSEIAELL